MQIVREQVEAGRRSHLPSKASNEVENARRTYLKATKEALKESHSSVDFDVDKLMPIPFNQIVPVSSGPGRYSKEDDVSLVVSIVPSPAL